MSDNRWNIANPFRSPANMTGPFVKMFDIPPNAANQAFVANPYQAGKCAPCDVACFSLTKGMLGCTAPTDERLIWNGQLIKQNTLQAQRIPANCNLTK